MQYLYTLPECGECENARRLLGQEDYTEILINNPLLSLGVQQFFQDGKPHAPLLVKPDGVYFLIQDKFQRIARLTNAEPI